MRGKLGDRVRLQHIVDAIVEIETYTQGVDFELFNSNSMMRFACIKQMEIIGEASNHISETTKNGFPDIEWEQIVGMRNVFVHEYFGVDSNLAWEIIKTDIPELKQRIIEILNRLSSEPI